ncbi:alpha/beta hydrolase [Sorangium sp. So ce131]|uniref:alpha/beta hydrolase n=1 Tax=Sorangium sp. So ce131 TaxID=3133282 RepID=UPI003F63EB7C
MTATSGFRPGARCRVALALAGGAALVPLGGALLVFVGANGATLSALALASLPVLVVLLCFIAPRVGRRRRRRVLRAALALFLVDAVYVGARLVRAAPGGPAVRYCEEGDCTRVPPLLARLVDEDETALAGLGFASMTGLIGGAEERALEALLRISYGELRASPRFEGSPNAALVGASSGQARALAWVPPGRPSAPCLVFLHGFGGQLSIYLSALVDAGLGDEFVIVAPFLDAGAQWWRPEGEAAVRDLVEHHLPPSADRGRVFLVGLSNGAIGAARLAQRGEVRRLFRGVILLSGAAEAQAADLAGLDVLVITGAEDPRFPLRGIEQDAASFRERGAAVELEVLAGDHFVLLSDKRAVAARMRTWLEPRSR